MDADKPRVVPGRPKPDGTRRWYYYATRAGGKSFWVSEGPEPLQRYPRAFREAWEAAKKGPEPDTFKALCLSYLATLTRGTRKRSAATVRGYQADVEAILQMPLKGGRPAASAPVRTFDNIRVVVFIAAWHNSMAEKPRTADMRLGTLCRILEHGKANGLLSFNRAASLPKMYERPVGEHEPVSETDFLRFVGEGCPAALAEAAWLARLIGMRRTDLATAPATSVLDRHIRWRTSKGKRKDRIAIYPITDGVCALLASIARRRAEIGSDAPTLLFGQRGAPWTPSGLDTALKRRREAAQTPSITWHGLRRMAVTDLLLAHVRDSGLVTRPMLKDAFGWTEADLDQMLRTYADEEAVADAITASPVSIARLPH